MKSAIVAALLLATSTGVAVGPDHAGAEVAPWLTGRVLSPTGHPLAEVNIVVLARPADAVTAKLPVGSVLPDTTVATVSTVGDGSFSVPLPTVNLLRDALRGGVVNFVIDAFGSQGMTTYMFSGRSGSLLATHIPTLKLLPGTARPRISDVSGPADTASPDLAQCQEIDDPPNPKTATVVGGSYSEMNGVSANFVYATSASTTMGSAVSGSGAFGSFSASGSSTHSLTGQQGYQQDVGKDFTHYKTDYDYEETDERCGGGNSGAPVSDQDFTVSGGQWDAGGPETHGQADPDDAYCVPELKGEYYKTGKQEAQTFSAGVDLSGWIGISLFSESDYSQFVHIKYLYSSNGLMCGQYGPPGNSAPGALEAEPSS